MGGNGYFYIYLRANYYLGRYTPVTAAMSSRVHVNISSSILYYIIQGYKPKPAGGESAPPCTHLVFLILLRKVV
jgi:hypothetical protein